MRPQPIPRDLKPTQRELESACHTYYAADARAAELRRQADIATAEAERLRIFALDLCERA